jgi:hypothetical protein
MEKYAISTKPYPNPQNDLGIKIQYLAERVKLELIHELWEISWFHQ